MPRFKMLSGKFAQRDPQNPGRTIKRVKGDVFEATPFEVRGIMDLVQPLDKVEEYQEPMKDDVPRTKFQAVHRGFGKWDVVNTETGENINDKPLTKPEAKQLVDDTEELEIEEEIKKEEEKARKEAKQKKEQAKLDRERKAIKDEKEGESDGGEPSSKEEADTKEETRDSKAVGGKRRVRIGRGSKSE